MNVVVSAIVDPWVTTLSFVVALAMRIQVRKKLREALGYDPISNRVGEGYCFKRDSDD